VNKRKLFRKISKLTGEPKSSVSIVFVALKQIVEQNAANGESTSVGFIKFKVIDRQIGLRKSALDQLVASQAGAVVEVVVSKELREAAFKDPGM